MQKEITDRAASLKLSSIGQADLNFVTKEFGTKMRACREKAGWDLVDLANHTKITIGIIESIEAGDLKAIPGSVFGRGFIKNICRAIDQDSGELLKEFDKVWALLHQPQGPVQIQENKVANTSDPVEMPDEESSLTESRDLKKFWLASLALIVGATVYSYVSKISGFVVVPPAAQSTKANPIIETASVADSGIPGTAVESDSQLATDRTANTPESMSQISRETETGKDQGGNIKQQDDSESSPVMADGEVAKVSENAQAEEAQKSSFAAEEISISSGMKVSIVVTKEVKIKAKIDDKREDVLSLAPGSYNYSFEQFAEMLIMDASAVQVSFNGKSLGVLGAPGRVRRISFAKDQEQLKRVF